MSENREAWSYSGEVWTDDAGRAVVTLPAFARLHPAGFEYELTPVGSGCEATVADPIMAEQFTVATSEPHVKVAWRVTALRETPSEEGGNDAMQRGGAR